MSQFYLKKKNEHFKSVKF